MSALFKLNEENVAISSVYTSDWEPNHMHISAGIYNENHEYTGKSYSGNIPYKKLLKWAIDAGYVQLVEF